MRTRLLLSLALPAMVGLAAVRADDKPPVLERPKVTDSITEKPIDELVKGLTASDVERKISEDELSRRGTKAVPPLVKCLLATENSTDARLSAARCLRKIKDLSAATALLDVYKNSGVPLAIRGEAALALGDMGATSAIPDLIEGLANGMFKVSATARQALITIGEPAVQPVIDAYKKEMSVQENPKWKEKEKEAYAARDGIVFYSLLILGDIGGPKARTTLVEALASQKEPPKKGSRAVGIRHHAGLGIGLLRASDKEYKLAIEPLLAAYEVEKDFSVATILARSLEWLTDAHDIPAQPYRWKAWWNVNKDRILEKKDASTENLEIPIPPIKAPDSPKKDEKQPPK
jgi:HEAT repeat protein